MDEFACYDNLEIENMDKFVDNFVHKVPYKNKNELSPQWPFRMLIVGSSSIGKTNTLLNIIMKQIVFDKLYLYVKDPTEDKYQCLLGFLTHLQNEFEPEEPFYEIGTTVDDVVKCDDLESEKQNLIIFDDFVTERHQESISDLFIRCRKRNASAIYQTQNLFSVPQNIRKNCNYVLLFNTNKRERKELAKTYATDIESKDFENIYMEATREPYSFLLIDLKTEKKCMRYRKQFNGLLINC